MLERRSPLDGHALLIAARARATARTGAAAASSDAAAPGTDVAAVSIPATAASTHAAAADAGAVTLAARHPHRLLQVSAFAASIDGAAERLAASLQLALPPPNRFSGTAQLSLRSIGHGVWQIAGDEGVPAAAPLREALADVATVADLSHARAALRVSGPAAARTLARHCALDLDPAAFPTGAATNTRFDHLGMTLARIDDAPTFELLVFRGYAVFVFEALAEAAEESGLQVRT